MLTVFTELYESRDRKGSAYVSGNNLIESKVTRWAGVAVHSDGLPLPYAAVSVSWSQISLLCYLQ
jgi:hypothetical protein